LEDSQASSGASPDRSRARTAPGRRPWRVGRSLGRTVYDADDRLLGMLDTSDLAAVVVACVNAQPAGATVTLDPRCSWCGRPATPYVDPPEDAWLARNMPRTSAALAELAELADPPETGG
jgi:hypothetical protein